MIIFATCHDSSTELSFAIAESIIEKDDITLLKDAAIQTNLIHLLHDHPTLPVICISHGEQDFWVGNDDKPALTASGDFVLQHRKIFAYACKTATTLGAQLAQVDNCFYWGYNNTILVVGLELQPTIVPILKHIKTNFHTLSDEVSIVAFLSELRELCDTATEEHSIWLVNEDKL